MTFLLIAGFPDSLIQFRGPLIDAIIEKKLTVHVAAPDLPEESEIYQTLQNKGVVVHQIPLRRTGTNPIADFILLVYLVKLMLRIRPDYVMGYTIKPVIYGTLAAILTNVPRRFALITGLGYAFQGEGKRGLLRALVQKLYAVALRGANKVFFQNPDDQELFRSLGILSASTPSYVVNGSGVDISQFNVVKIPSPPIRFLMIARLLGDKGVREYVAAAEKIREQYADVKFDLVGWIDENPDAIHQQELDQWISKGYVEFLGKLKDVRPAIAASSVYVLPSYREGTPRTVLEAMALGRPIITTDAPGCRETVVDGYNGFLVPVKSVDELVTAMKKFITDPELVMTMGVASRELAEHKYDVNKVNASMLQEMGIS